MTEGKSPDHTSDINSWERHVELWCMKLKDVPTKDIRKWQKEALTAVRLGTQHTQRISDNPITEWKTLLFVEQKRKEHSKRFLQEILWGED